MMRRTRLLAVALLGLVVSMSLAADVVLVGKNPGKVKGRWLKIYDPQAFTSYKKAVLGNVDVEIVFKNPEKKTPIDEELLKGQIRETLAASLRDAEVFTEVLEENSAENAEHLVRLDCHLLVETGNRAMRYLVGYGAGKSKSILEIHLKDQETGKEVGLYHGYGTGSGMGFKLAGGGARKMSQDDIQENTAMFTKLLQDIVSG